MNSNSACSLILNVDDFTETEKTERFHVDKPAENLNKISDIDDVFSQIGQFGPYQFLIIVLVGLIAASAAISSYLTIFTDAAPEFRCKLPFLKNDTFEITSEYQQELVDIYIPNSEADKSCKIRRFNNQSSNFSPDNFTLVNCQEWVYSKKFYTETIVTRFNYVCDREEEKGVYKTLLFAGQFGVIVIGLLADKFGRKNIAYLFLALNGFVAILFAFISNIQLSDSTFKILFGTLRLFSGCTSNIYSLAVVFAVEIVGPSYRVLAANTIYYFFIFGELICLLLGYFFRDYKQFYLYSAIVISSGVVYFWYIPESPRYLILKNRQNEVNNLFKKIAKYNKKSLNVDFQFESATTAATPSSKTTSRDSIKRKLTIFKSRKILFIVLASMINWFTNSFVYNGLSYNIDVLGGDPYLNFLYSSLSELAGVACSQYLLKKFGRKIPYTCNMIIISLSLCVIGVVPEGSNAIIIICVLLGKFAISFTFNAIYVITSESYPTEIRNTAVSFLATFARIGGTISAYVQLLGGQVWKPLPYVIYGLMALVSALLFGFLMPETQGKKMPETIEDMLEEDTK